MKLIIAYIKPERLNAVKQELYAREIFKISVTNALGCGQQKGYVSTYRGSEIEVNLHKKVRLAIGVNDEFVEKTVEGIIAGARTGYIGDGKIFILPMEECIRIRTGERGAGRLLRDRTLNCKEIAARLGFASAGSFARAFRNHYKISPTQYLGK